MGKKGRSRQWSRLQGWLDDRFQITPILNFAVFRRVPKSPWYYGAGAALLFLLFVLVGTGSFLALSYSPSTDQAHDSVVRISQVNVLGWFVRGLHYWSAGMMVLCLLFHMFRQIVLGGYKSPREGTWFIGVGLFSLVLVNAFTGYTLRWDVSSAAAVRVVLNAVHRIPAVGESLVKILQGGDSIGTETISRLFAVHVIFVPFGLLMLVGYHLYLVIRHGITTHAERERPMASGARQKQVYADVKSSETEGTDFYPWTAAKSAVFALSVFSVAVFLTIAYGAPVLGPHPNSPEPIIPMEEWWFHWVSGLVAILPPDMTSVVYIGLPVGLVLLLLALPLIDRGKSRGAKHRPFAVIAVSVAVLALLGLSSYRLQSPFTAWPRSDLPPIPPGVELTPAVEAGRHLFVQYGCFHCHAIGEHGSGVGPNLTALKQRLSKEQLFQYISEPPPDVAMPSYRNLATAEELERLVEFVLVAQTFPRSFEHEGL